MSAMADLDIALMRYHTGRASRAERRETRAIVTRLGRPELLNVRPPTGPAFTGPVVEVRR